ncbi:MAG: PQQ-binding-like beta-propeller repeat protein [bacterium]
MDRRLRAAVFVAALVLPAGCRKPPVNLPPDPPSRPAGPAHGDRSITCEFTASAADPDGDSVAVRFAWGDGDTSEWSAWAGGGDTVAGAHSWSAAGSFLVRAQARDRPETESDWSSPHGIEVADNLPPDAPSRPAGPGAVPKDSAVAYSAAATDPNGDSVAVRFAWGDGDTSSWSEWRPSGTTAAASHAFGRAGAYAVRAQARDRRGALSACSDSLAVSVSSRWPPDVPEVPSGPAEGRPGRPGSFSSSARHPGGDSVSLRFAWGDGDTSEWSGPVAPGETVVMNHAWSDTGTFRLTAQARDEDGAVSGWSAEHALTVVNRRPGTPRTPTGPARVHPDFSHNYSASGLDPDGDSIYLRFSWGDGDTSDWRGPFAPGETFTMSHAWRIADTCQLRAQARDVYGAHSVWSGMLIVEVTYLKWTYQTGGYVMSSPAVGDDGTVYVGSYDSCLHAVGPDGGLRWRYAAGGALVSSPAVGDDGTVYVGSDDSCLHAVNPDGTPRWRYATGGLVQSSPAIAADGTVYVGSGDGRLYAVGTDGTERWRYATGGPVRSSPAVAADGTVYFGSDDGGLYALDRDGGLRWQYRTGRLVASSPAIGGDGTVYVGSDDRYLYALHPDGSLRWRYLTGGHIRSTPAIAADGTILVLGTWDRTVYALHPDGSLRARFFEALSSPAMAAGGTMYVCSWRLGREYYRAITAWRLDGTVHWVYITRGFESSPAVAADGTVYVASVRGELFALQTVETLAPSSWPRARHDNRNTGRVGAGR